MLKMRGMLGVLLGEAKVMFFCNNYHFQPFLAGFKYRDLSCFVSKCMKKHC